MNRVKPTSRSEKAKEGASPVVALNEVAEINPRFGKDKLPDDFDYAPFSQRGGLGKAHQLFGADLTQMFEELNGALTL